MYEISAFCRRVFQGQAKAGFLKKGLANQVQAFIFATLSKEEK